MPIRNPFRRAPGAEAAEEAQRAGADNGFKNTAVSGAKPLDIKETAEYKLSGKTIRRHPRARSQDASHGYGLTLALEINDSGVYLPVRCAFLGPEQLRLQCDYESLVPSQLVLTLAPAIPAAGEAHLLALQVKCLHHILESPESAR